MTVSSNARSEKFASKWNINEETEPDGDAAEGYWIGTAPTNRACRGPWWRCRGGSSCPPSSSRRPSSLRGQFSPFRGVGACVFGVPLVLAQVWIFQTLNAAALASLVLSFIRKAKPVCVRLFFTPSPIPCRFSHHQVWSQRRPGPIWPSSAAAITGLFQLR